MAYSLTDYEGNCSISLQNCRTLYPKTTSISYGPPFTNASCVPYSFYNSSDDIGICGWKGAPCVVDSTGRTNCNDGFGSCRSDVCSGALGDPCTSGLAPFCMGVIQCGIDSRCGGAGAGTNAHVTYGTPIAQLCLSGVTDARGKCTPPTSASDLPATEPSSPSTSSSSSPAQPSTSAGTTGVNLQVIRSLENCACRSSKCSFTPNSTTNSYYMLIIGQPVANCQKGNNLTMKTKFVQSMSISETWSVDASAGFTILGLKIGATAGWSKSKSVEASQEVELEVAPGKMGALVANVSYQRTSGEMKIDSSSLSMVSVQPRNILTYQAQYSACGSEFQAVTLGSASCSTGISAYDFSFNPFFVILLFALWPII